MTDNKKHWYDGWFYDKIIAPNQDKLFRQIKDLIEPGSDVIDVGCGTGRLGFTQCNSVADGGIEYLSAKAGLIIDKEISDSQISNQLLILGK